MSHWSSDAGRLWLPFLVLVDVAAAAEPLGTETEREETMGPDNNAAAPEAAVPEAEVLGVDEDVNMDEAADVDSVQLSAVTDDAQGIPEVAEAQEVPEVVEEPELPTVEVPRPQAFGITNSREEGAMRSSPPPLLRPLPRSSNRPPLVRSSPSSSSSSSDEVTILRSRPVAQLRPASLNINRNWERTASSPRASPRVSPRAPPRAPRPRGHLADYAAAYTPSQKSYYWYAPAARHPGFFNMTREQFKELRRRIKAEFGANLGSREYHFAQRPSATDPAFIRAKGFLENVKTGYIRNVPYYQEPGNLDDLLWWQMRHITRLKRTAIRGQELRARRADRAREEAEAQQREAEAEAKEAEEEEVGEVEDEEEE